MSIRTFPLRTALPLASAGEVHRRLDTARSRALFGLGACVMVGSAAGLGVKVGIAALLVVILALVVLRRPTVGTFILVAAVPALSGLRRGLPIPGLRISEAMIAGIATLILLAAKPGHTPRWRAFDWLAIAYVLATALFGVFDLRSRGAGVTVANANKLLGPLQFFLLYRAVLTALTSEDQRRTAMRLILWASVPVSLLALLQQAHVAGVPRFLANVTGSEAYFTASTIPRATGPFPFWHELGSYLFVVALFGVALLVTGSGRVVNPKLLLGIVFLAVMGVISTVSFTPILGVLVGCLLLLIMGRRFRRWLVVFAAFAAVIAIFFGSLLTSRYHEQFGAHAPVKEYSFLPQNLNFRIYVWNTEFVPVLKSHVATGYGPDLPNLKFAYTESIYVTLLLRGGLPLLAIYAGLMIALALRARELRRDSDPDRRAVAWTLFVVTLLIVLMQTTTNYFVNDGFPQVFWVLAALLFIEREGRPISRTGSRFDALRS